MHIRAKTKHWGKTILPVQLRDKIASDHTSGEEFRKKIYSIEGTQKNINSIIHNVKHLELPGLFLELAKLSNW